MTAGPSAAGSHAAGDTKDGGREPTTNGHSPTHSGGDTRTTMQNDPEKQREIIIDCVKDLARYGLDIGSFDNARDWARELLQFVEMNWYPIEPSEYFWCNMCEKFMQNNPHVCV